MRPVSDDIDWSLASTNHIDENFFLLIIFIESSDFRTTDSYVYKKWLEFANDYTNGVVVIVRQGLQSVEWCAQRTYRCISLSLRFSAFAIRA